jgi:hypothetical protein
MSGVCEDGAGPWSDHGMNGTAMTCGKCGADVSSAKRLKDSKGRYFCEPCAGALRQRAMEKLGPTVESPVPTIEAVESMRTTTPAALGSTPPAEDGTIALAPEPVPEAPARAPVRSTTLPAGTRPKRAPRMCVQCGYDLSGLKTPKCPECGTVNSKYARAKAEEKQTLKAMYVKPLIMAGVGVAIACLIFWMRGLPVPFFLMYYAAAVPVGFLAYIGLSIAMIGFDEPLGVTFLRIAAVLAVADAFTSAIDAIPYIGWWAWPLEGFIYTVLLMSVMELDFEEARIVALVTFLLHLGLFFSAWYVWLTYF